MKKLTFIIDGNYFLFRSFYVLPKSSGKALDTKKEMDIFIRKLSIDFTSEIRKFRNTIDQIIFTIDSKSWRKDFFPDAEYKANRSEDSNVNWENFYKVFDIFKEILEKKGVILHKIDGAEGDDLIFAWSVNCNLQGKSIIIFSGDKDLIQLVNNNTLTNAFTLWYSSASKRLVTYEGFSDWLNTEDIHSSDIFSMQKTITGDSALKSNLIKIIKELSLDVEEVNSCVFGFKKVLTGDAGDNIKSVYYYTDINKNGQNRMYSITDKKAENILIEFEKKYGKFKIEFLYDESYQKNICNILIKNLSATRMSYEQIYRNLQDNTNLVILHQKSIPESIYNQIFENIENIENKIITNFDILSSKEELLKGTIYLDERSSDFFKGESIDDDMSFIKKNKTFDNIF